MSQTCPDDAIASPPPSPVPDPPGDRRPHPLRDMRVFGATFAAIFLAEVGDKTQVAVLLMAAESHNPWTVFLGAATALIATSLVGVVLGQWLAKRLSAATLELAVGALLLLVAVLLSWDVVMGN
ncbi:MAG: TMEM165/GDT1 family protein [Cyanobacteria bacterium]|nr:TMEM165/GDT1 family protein [Cyanobacteriota bacterium]